MIIGVGIRIFIVEVGVGWLRRGGKSHIGIEVVAVLSSSWKSGVMRYSNTHFAAPLPRLHVPRGPTSTWPIGEESYLPKQLLCNAFSVKFYGPDAYYVMNLLHTLQLLGKVRFN